VMVGLFSLFTYLVDEGQCGRKILETKGARQLTTFDLPTVEGAEMGSVALGKLGEGGTDDELGKPFDPA
jgi:hypothetical protein